MARRSRRDGFFGWLLRLFPSEFRGDFGREMAADFQDQHADATATGRRTVARLWMRTLVDVARRVPIEHLDILRRDAGYAVRVLRRRPAFAATVTLTLAISIGLNTAVFSVAAGILLRALPQPNGDRVVRLFYVDATAPTEFQDASSPDLEDWQSRTQTLDALALSTMASPGVLLSAAGDPELTTGLVVTERFFDIIGARPALGRAFTADEYADGTMLNFVDSRPSVALLSHALWQEHFGGRPDVVGTTFQVGGRTLEVVGVMPKALDLRGVSRFPNVRYWLPGRANTVGAMSNRRNRRRSSSIPSAAHLPLRFQKTPVGRSRSSRHWTAWSTLFVRKCGCSPQRRCACCSLRPRTCQICCSHTRRAGDWSWLRAPRSARHALISCGSC
jgi:hypothetical protein